MIYMIREVCLITKVDSVTSFLRCINQASTSSRWKMWWHGSTRTVSPIAKSERHIAQSTCDSCQACSCCCVGQDVEELALASKDSTPRSKSTSHCDVEEVSWLSRCFFSGPVPVHTREGRFLTMSSGARSR